MKYKIFTDGSCIGNPGPGGYSAVIISERKNSTRKINIKGNLSYTTNNRAELTAVIKSLENVRDNSTVEIYTDSKYIVEVMTRHIHEWLRNGWRKISGEDVINRDLWQMLIEITREKNLKVDYIKVKAHANCFHNNRADKLAKQQAYKYLP